MLEYHRPYLRQGYSHWISEGDIPAEDYTLEFSGKISDCCKHTWFCRVKFENLNFNTSKIGLVRSSVASLCPAVLQGWNLHGRLWQLEYTELTWRGSDNTLTEFKCDNHVRQILNTQITHIETPATLKYGRIDNRPHSAISGLFFRKFCCNIHCFSGVLTDFSHLDYRE